MDGRRRSARLQSKGGHSVHTEPPLSRTSPAVSNPNYTATSNILSIPAGSGSLKIPSPAIPSCSSTVPFTSKESPAEHPNPLPFRVTLTSTDPITTNAAPMSTSHVPYADYTQRVPSPTIADRTITAIAQIPQSDPSISSDAFSNLTNASDSSYMDLTTPSPPSKPLTLPIAPMRRTPSTLLSKSRSKKKSHGSLVILHLPVRTSLPLGVISLLTTTSNHLLYLLMMLSPLISFFNYPTNSIMYLRRSQHQTFVTMKLRPD